MKKRRILLVLMILVSLVSINAASSCDNEGFLGDADNPPEGSTLDQSFTDYYGIPVAADGGDYYWYSDGCWFPTTSKDDFGCCCHSDMPITPLVLVGFIGAVLALNYKRFGKSNHV